MSKASIKEERRKKEKRQQIFTKMRQIFAKFQRKFRRDSVNINCLHFKKVNEKCCHGKNETRLAKKWQNLQ